MTKPKQTKAQRIAELERKLMEAEALQVHNYHFASAGLDKASTDHLMASAVILTLTAIGGRVICRPVAIKDGLSKETIAALKADMVRGYADTVAFKPKEAA
jgi:hypothetical protein